MARTTKQPQYAVSTTEERILELLTWKGHATEQEVCEELQIRASEFRRVNNRLVTEGKVGMSPTGGFVVVGG